MTSPVPPGAGAIFAPAPCYPRRSSQKRSGIISLDQLKVKSQSMKIISRSGLPAGDLVISRGQILFFYNIASVGEI